MAARALISDHEFRLCKRSEGRHFRSLSIVGKTGWNQRRIFRRAIYLVLSDRTQPQLGGPLDRACLVGATIANHPQLAVCNDRLVRGSEPCHDMVPGR